MPFRSLIKVEDKGGGVLSFLICFPIGMDITMINKCVPLREYPINKSHVLHSNVLIWTCTTGNICFIISHYVPIDVVVGAIYTCH